MENAAGIGTVTPAMVEARARELAAINGHPSSDGRFVLGEAPDGDAESLADGLGVFSRSS